MEVVMANVWINVLPFEQEIPKMPFTDSLKFAPAVGLAIPCTI